MKIEKIISGLLIVLMVITGSIAVFADIEKDDTSNDLLPLSVIDLKFSCNKNLSEEEIAKRFDEVNEKYGFYEPFSLEDTEFIRAYANPVKNNSLTRGIITRFDVNKKRTYDGITATIKGSVWVDEGVINHSFGGDLVGTATQPAGKTIKKLTAYVQIECYGILGSTGVIGKVYSGELPSSVTNNTSINFSKSKVFSAVLLYYSIGGFLDVEYNNGSFTVS